MSKSMSKKSNQVPKQEPQPEAGGPIDQAELLRVLTAIRDGDFSQTLAAQSDPIADVINQLVANLALLTTETRRVVHEIGVEGKLGGQVDCPQAQGAWKAFVDAINTLSFNLTVQVRHFSSIAEAVVHGDASQRITADARGEVADFKKTLNEMFERV